MTGSNEFFKVDFADESTATGDDDSLFMAASILPPRLVQDEPVEQALAWQAGIRPSTDHRLSGGHVLLKSADPVLSPEALFPQASGGFFSNLTASQIIPVAFVIAALGCYFARPWIARISKWSPTHFGKQVMKPDEKSASTSYLSMGMV